MIWGYIAAFLAILGLAITRKYLNNVFAAGLIAAAIFAFFAAIGSEASGGAGVEWWMPAAVALATFSTAIMQRTPTL